MIGIVRFFVRNPVPSNLITVGVIIGGITAAFHIRREFFPDIEPDMALVVMSFPGASPAEVEESLARRVEDVAVEVEGVSRLVTAIFEGGGATMVQFDDGVDVRKRTENLRERIEALADLPPEAERIRVVEFEPNLPVIQVTIAGEADLQTMKQTIRQVSDDLKTFPGMGQVVVSGTRDDELRVEVNFAEAVRHGISVTRVADSISAWMREVHGGTVRGIDGEVKVRTLGVEERSDRVRGIVVKGSDQGAIVKVGDIATVREGYVEDDVSRRFNGMPSANCTVFRKSGQDAVDMAQFTRGYVAARRGDPLNPTWRERLFGSPRLQGYELGATRGPPDFQIHAHNDLARLIEGRLELLTSNALQGGILVFVVLLLGLHWRAACFVTLGIVVAIFGSLLVMDSVGISLNLLTMFALLIALGMLADDAIVFSESIETEAQRGGDVEEVVIRGVKLVLWPVVASVTTTIVAFVPLLLLRGRVGDIMGELPIVVSLALLCSLAEAIFLLPGHLAESISSERRKELTWLDKRLRGLDRWREQTLWPRLEAGFERVSRWSIDRRYVTVSIGISLFILSAACVIGGRLPFTFLPTDDAETAVVDIRLPLGVPSSLTKEVGARLERAAREQSEVRAITSIYGVRLNYETAVADNASSNLAQIFIELAPVEDRERRSGEILDSIIRGAGPLNEVESLSVREISGGPSGADVTYEVGGENIDEIREVVEGVKSSLIAVDGVISVADNDFDAQPELQIEPHPGAAAIGLSAMEIARQVRGALFGIDAHIYSDNREDIDVRVRIDSGMRAATNFGERLWIISPSGAAVPLQEVAKVRERTSPSSISRIDRLRTVVVTADTAQGTRPEGVVERIGPDLRELAAKYPGVVIREGGRQQDLNDAFAALPYAGAAALLMIYAILAWMFSSYLQPIGVMFSIPFGVIRMVFGHLLFGTDLTFLSIIGLVALAGIVVNNAIVLIDFANTEVAAGVDLHDALISAGTRRLRAILLTSITTIFGLGPLILEQSFQARFLAPMAITIAGGLASATALTLLLLPAVILIIDDLKRLMGLVTEPANALVGAEPAQEAIDHGSTT